MISKGETCPRCGSTEEALRKAESTLKQSLALLGIEVILEKEELSVTEFKKDPLQSNRIWINNRLLEDWIEGRVGHSPCCDVAALVIVELWKLKDRFTTNQNKSDRWRVAEVQHR